LRLDTGCGGVGGVVVWYEVGFRRSLHLP
jgi:hypothetical protein